MNKLPPWQLRSWAQFHLRREQLPHALLLAGAPGLGKRLLLEAMLASLFCTAPQPETSEACGVCRGCIVHAAGNHPDFHTLGPEPDRVTIGVDQVRAFSEALCMTPQANRWQIGVIDPAEAMTPQAANALLKTLEEPAAQTLILLVSDHPGKLLPTLLSRSQRWPPGIPTPEQAINWLAGEVAAAPADRDLALQLAGGAPIAAAELLRSGRVASFRELTRELDELSESGEQLAFAKRWVMKFPEFVQGYEQILVNRMKLLSTSLTGRQEILSLARQREQLLKLRDWQGSGVRLDLALMALLSA